MKEDDGASVRCYVSVLSCVFFCVRSWRLFECFGTFGCRVFLKPPSVQYVFTFSDVMTQWASGQWRFRSYSRFSGPVCDAILGRRKTVRVHLSGPCKELHFQFRRMTHFRRIPLLSGRQFIAMRTKTTASFHHRRQLLCLIFNLCLPRP